MYIYMGAFLSFTSFRMLLISFLFSLLNRSLFFFYFSTLRFPTPSKEGLQAAALAPCVCEYPEKV